jgi:uroporphyrinogen-III synthase
VTPLVIIRPQPGCDATLTVARDLRLDAHGFPLFEIAPVAWEAPDPSSIDALLIGSANAVRHAGEQLSLYAGKPAYAVGRATAEVAQQAGLAIAMVGSGGLQAVLNRIDPAHRHVLRLAGRERRELSAPPGVSMTERVIYASEARPMPPELAAILASPALVMLHSAGAARHFAAECTRLGIERARVALAAIGPRVAQAAGTGWAAVETAEKPDDTALLALAHKMCKSVGGSSAE